MELYTLKYRDLDSHARVVVVASYPSLTAAAAGAVELLRTIHRRIRITIEYPEHDALAGPANDNQ